ncbi:MFS transporter [Fictibacillus sp. WQ 8-8]|uniref:MFS transporter n=1 Tax=Fictibacillus sp. WQ 8-8 TaxID=2938788 RepID=UPI00210A3DD0|nr:MFS transporter [Fictibacillus sp. WQ 8-8]MCQ6266713.1 MFS transporter [Fictibacillus sp. WQ 8-8]
MDFDPFIQIISRVGLTRDLQIGPTLLGVILAMASVGAFFGSLLANYIGTRFKTGPTIFEAMFVACLAPLLVPIMASGPFYITSPILIISFFLGGVGVVISNVHVISLRQTITHENLLGRMNASYRIVVSGVTPIGALLGGYLGTFIGLRLTLVVGAIGTVTALVWIVFSPLPKLSNLPVEEEESGLPEIVTSETKT